VPPTAALGWLGSWLTDSELRSEVREVCRWVGTDLSLSKGWLDDRGLHASVRPALERALRAGRLVLVERSPARPLPTFGAPEEAPAAPRSFDAIAPERTTFVDEPPPTMVWELVAEVEPGPGWEPAIDVEEGPAWEPQVLVGLVGAAGAASATAEDGAGGEDGAEESGEVYAIAAHVHLLGDDPAVNHAVRILDPDTGAVVVDSLTTDDEGVLRAEVPENKEYRIELVELDHEESDVPAATVDDDGAHAYLRCRFVDGAGNPVANTEVDARFGEDGEEMPFVTDADGMIEGVAHLGVYELKIDDQTFHAHSVPSEDADRDDALHVFEVGSAGAEEESDPASAETPERLPRHEPVAGEGEDSPE